MWVEMFNMPEVPLFLYDVTSGLWPKFINKSFLSPQHKRHFIVGIKVDFSAILLCTMPSIGGSIYRAIQLFDVLDFTNICPDYI